MTFPTKRKIPALAASHPGEQPLPKKPRASKDEAMLLMALTGSSTSAEQRQEQDSKGSRRGSFVASLINTAGDSKTKKETPSTPTAPTKSTSSGRVRLPDKLMGFLNGQSVSKDVLWWQPDGDGFAFDHDRVQKEFLDVHFRGTKLASFIRSLNRWGFRRIFYHSLPKNALSFHHPSFQKKHPEKVQDMKMVGGTHAVLNQMAGRSGKKINPSGSPPPSPKSLLPLSKAISSNMPTAAVNTATATLGQQQVLLSNLVQLREPSTSGAASEPLWKKLLLGTSTSSAASVAPKPATTSTDTTVKNHLQQLVAVALQQQSQEQAVSSASSTHQRLLELVRQPHPTPAPSSQDPTLLLHLLQSQRQHSSAPAPTPSTALVQAQLAQQQAIHDLLTSQRRMQALQQQMKQGQ